MFDKLTKPLRAAIYCGVSLVFSYSVQALPDGFELTVLTDDVENARQMVQSPSGIIYVGSRQVGNVYAVVPNESNNDADVTLIVSGLLMPSGLTLVNGDLIIAAVNQVIRIPDIDNVYATSPDFEVITATLPSDRHHGWKYVEADSEGNIYFNVGAPCNICLSDDERYASIMKMNLATKHTSIYAHGVRNSVGFAWHPVTGLLWFSDNGRDWMGPDRPLEEINVVSTPGEHFGYPFVHDAGLLDPEFGEGKNPKDYTPPVFYIRAHSAALGLAFYTADQFPERYRHALFIAEHGSWNHMPAEPRGYRVSVLIQSDNGLDYEPFADQWLVDGKVSGRPNDVIVANDGSLLISDDQKGAIYRVTYKAAGN